MEPRPKGRLAWERLPSGTLETGALLRTLRHNCHPAEAEIDNPPVHAGGFFLSPPGPGVAAVSAEFERYDELTKADKKGVLNRFCEAVGEFPYAT
jgi:hypothetical protein